MLYQRSYSIQFRVDINLKFDTYSSDELPCSKFQLNPYGAPDPFIDLGGVLHPCVYAYSLKWKWSRKTEGYKTFSKIAMQFGMCLCSAEYFAFFFSQRVI